MRQLQQPQPQGTRRDRLLAHQQAVKGGSARARRGAWHLGGSRFMQLASMQAFAVASFSDERRCGRGLNDPTSLQVCCSGEPGWDWSPLTCMHPFSVQWPATGHLVPVMSAQLLSEAWLECPLQSSEVCLRGLSAVTHAVLPGLPLPLPCHLVGQPRSLGLKVP